MSPGYLRSPRGRGAFSLIEIMVTVGLLSFIVLGLVAMFSQTQRAFTSSMAQVDVLEAGRALTETLSRELAEAVPSDMPYDTTLRPLPPPLQTNMGTINFVSEPNQLYADQPFFQDLPGSGLLRTNVQDRVFFLSRYNQTWKAIAYEIVPEYKNAGVGALCRYVSPGVRRDRAPLLYGNYMNYRATGSITNRIADGIVHFRIRPLDRVGNLVTPDLWLRPSPAPVTNTFVQWTPNYPGEPGTYFCSNAVPAALELELGILEPQALARYRSLPVEVPEARKQFLSNHVAQVHIFRQRIPIRNFDPSVYQ